MTDEAPYAIEYGEPDTEHVGGEHSPTACGSEGHDAGIIFMPEAETSQI